MQKAAGSAGSGEDILGTSATPRWKQCGSTATRSSTAKTPGGHHRVPESEIDRLASRKNLERGDIQTRRGNFRKISGRNQLIGRVLSLKYSGLLAQVTMAIGRTAHHTRSHHRGRGERDAPQARRARRRVLDQIDSK